jgi:hypothetical protein
MKPQEKANELVNKYLVSTPIVFHIDDAKKCAIIAVDEIIQAIDWHDYEMPNNDTNYWLEVRKEIQNL